MNRRSTDEVEHQIREWRRSRELLAADAPSPVIAFIDDEIRRLEREAQARSRAMPHGRRATDKAQLPPPQMPSA